MTTYTNYQLPASHYDGNSYSQHTTQDPFVNQDHFATPPARLTSSAPASRSDSSSASNMTDIIASQERAMEQAKRASSSSRALTTTTNTHPSSSRTLVVQKSHNPGSSDAVHPLKKEMKQRRHVKMAAGGVGGALVGTLVLGPVGTVLGIPIGVYTTNKLSKQGERRAQRKFEQHGVQEQAMNSKAMQSAAFC
jgi:hypothetical protein